MGWNTVVVLYNDHQREIERALPRLGEAMRAWPFSRDHMDGDFGCGQVVSTDHADGRQIVSVGANTGDALHPDKPVAEADLTALAMILRGHGYTVKRPGRQRGEGPLPWGWAAKSPEDTER